MMKHEKSAVLHTACGYAREMSAVVEVMTQAEYTHDMIVQGDGGSYLVYAMT